MKLTLKQLKQVIKEAVSNAVYEGHYHDVVPTADEQTMLYRDRKNANGIDIRLRWDNSYDEFIIVFPQIDLSVGRHQEIYDQVLRIGTDLDVAKRVLDFAVKTASSTKDVYQLFKSTESFVG